VVCKPAEATPLTAIALSNLAKKAGFPEGAIEIVVGNAKIIGKELTSNPVIKKISFTGSTEVGKLLMTQAANTMKKITMELGGNAPFIVFGDADLDKAVDGAIKSRFRFSGQTCICANRFLVQEKIYDKFTKKLTEKVKALKIAPLINSEAIRKVEGLVKSAQGKILCGGKAKGNFFEPTVICDMKKPEKIFNTEIFGPVATIFKFKTIEEAIKLANDSEYGLAAYVYGADLNTTLHVAEQLEFGMVGVNDITINATHSPFGGMKQSGIGREGSHYGLEEFLEIKFISVGKRNSS
jgi:succinate-semialdehyde dehydrogenase/glutarate-semialdehyde dehydrogenase